MRRITWSMLFVFTIAVLGAVGCDNTASNSQKSSGVSGAATGAEGGKLHEKVGPGKSGGGGGGS